MRCSFLFDCSAAKYDEVYADLKSTAGILKVAVNLNVKKAADNRAPGRTLFVRSLSQKTTADTLRNAYEKFGDVVTAHVPWNHTTNESKCYGFVTFREKAGAHNALKTPTIKIDVSHVFILLAPEVLAPLTCEIFDFFVRIIMPNTISLVKKRPAQILGQCLFRTSQKRKQRRRLFAPCLDSSVRWQVLM